MLDEDGEGDGRGLLFPERTIIGGGFVSGLPFLFPLSPLANKQFISTISDCSA